MLSTGATLHNVRLRTQDRLRSLCPEQPLNQLNTCSNRALALLETTNPPHSGASDYLTACPCWVKNVPLCLALVLIHLLSRSTLYFKNLYCYLGLPILSNNFFRRLHTLSFFTCSMSYTFKQLTSPHSALYTLPSVLVLNVTPRKQCELCRYSCEMDPDATARVKERRRRRC